MAPLEHVDTKGNEFVDQLAKEGAALSEEWRGPGVEKGDGGRFEAEVAEDERGREADWLKAGSEEELESEGQLRTGKRKPYLSLTTPGHEPSRLEPETCSAVDIQGWKQGWKQG